MDNSDCRQTSEPFLTEKGIDQPTRDNSVHYKSFTIRLKKDKEYKIKFLTFMCLAWSFFILGWILAQFGPSLLDLQIITGTDLEEASFFYMSHNIGYLIGSIISGFLIGRCDSNLLLFVTMIVYGISVAAIPWCSLSSLMLFSQAVRGLSGGILDTVANAELLSLFGNAVNSYMQAMHFAFAVGGIVSPLVTAPFLADEIHLTTGSVQNNASLKQANHRYEFTNVSFIELGNRTDVLALNVSYSSEISKLYIPYSVTGILAISSAISFLLVYMKSRNFFKKAKDPPTEITRNERKLSVPIKFIILIILSFLFLLYTSMEDTVGAYVATFCVEQMKMTKQAASYVTALFWAFFALGRLIGIPVAKCFHSIYLFAIYSVILMLSFLLLSFSNSIDSEAVVWISTAITGFGMSILFPTIFTWVEEDLLLITGKIASLFIVTSTAGSIASPAALGYLIEEVTPMWYAYILLLESLGLLLFFIVAVFLKKTLYQLKHETRTDVTITIKPSAENTQRLSQNEIYQ